MQTSGSLNPHDLLLNDAFHNCLPETICLQPYPHALLPATVPHGKSRPTGHGMPQFSVPKNSRFPVHVSISMYQPDSNRLLFLQHILKQQYPAAKTEDEEPYYRQGYLRSRNLNIRMERAVLFRRQTIDFGK